MGRYDARLEALGEELMGALERFLLLQIIDERWREHLFDMDYLREGIHLRGFAQIDPLVAYKNEAFTLFGDLMNSVWTDFARMIFNVEVNVEEQNGAGPRAPPSRPPATPPAAAACPTPAATAWPEPVRWPRRRPRRASVARPSTTNPTKRCRSSSSGCWTTTSRSDATTPAGAEAARSSRSATAPERRAAFPPDRDPSASANQRPGRLARLGPASAREPPGASRATRQPSSCIAYTAIEELCCSNASAGVVRAAHREPAECQRHRARIDDPLDVDLDPCARLDQRPHRALDGALAFEHGAVEGDHRRFGGPQLQRRAGVAGVDRLGEQPR